MTLLGRDFSINITAFADWAFIFLNAWKKKKNEIVEIKEKQTEKLRIVDKKKSPNEFRLS